MLLNNWNNIELLKKILNKKNTYKKVVKKKCLKFKKKKI